MRSRGRSRAARRDDRVDVAVEVGERPRAVRPTGSSRPMFEQLGELRDRARRQPRATRRIAARRRVLGRARRRACPRCRRCPAMITSSVIACMRGASANGSPIGQRSISRSAASAIISRVALRPPRRGTAAAAACAGACGARPTRGEHRVRSDDRPQRRLAGQRGRLLRLGGEQRLDVVGVARDHAGRSWTIARCIRKTSPSSRRARKTNSIWRTLKRSVCSGARQRDRRRAAAGRSASSARAGRRRRGGPLLGCVGRGGGGASSSD